jgi:hypothetical protein
MDEVLKEQGFQSTGCTSQECVVEAGQLLGVKNIVAGSVGKVGSIYVISLRMIDVAKGNIVKNVDEEIEGDIADVLRVGLRNVARKMAGLEPDRAAVAPRAAAPVENVPPAVSNLEQRIRAASAERQEDLERRKALKAYMKSKSRKTLSLTVGRSSLDSKTFHWTAKDSFNVVYKDMKWESGPHFGIDVAPIRYYSNLEGHSFMFGNELGINFDKNTSASSIVDKTDSLAHTTTSLAFSTTSFKMTRLGIFDNLLIGWWIMSKPVSFEPFIGIGGQFDFDLISGKEVDDLSLFTVGLRFGFPMGIRIYGKRFFMGFEREGYFGSVAMDDNLSYDAKTGKSITGEFSFESVAYWAIHAGFMF